MKNNERNSFNVAFGTFIKEARIRKGIVQGDVSHHLGVTQSYYSLIESGARNVDLQVAIKICKYLGLDLNDFMAKQK